MTTITSGASCESLSQRSQAAGRRQRWVRFLWQISYSMLSSFWFDWFDICFNVPLLPVMTMLKLIIKEGTRTTYQFYHPQTTLNGLRRDSQRTKSLFLWHSSFFLGQSHSMVLSWALTNPLRLFASAQRPVWMSFHVSGSMEQNTCAMHYQHW